MEENKAAFAASANQTNLSYHWNSFNSGTNKPVEATTPRTTMPYTSSLTTISFDPAVSSLYQVKTINGIDRNCVLVGTFTPDPANFWSQESGKVVNLTYVSSNVTNYIFPYVTVGNDLRNYLTNTYFSSISPTSDLVALRIDQSLGLRPDVNLTVRGLAFFWAPIDHVVRSGYSPNVAQQVTGLSTFADGSYIPSENGLSPGFRYLDYGNSTVTYTTNNDFVSYNQAQTIYPWSAMGYTYNWNALQDGSNPAFGTDPAAPSSFVGLSEFMVSAGSDVMLEKWVPYSDLALWVVPEPGVLILVAIGFVFVLFRSLWVRRNGAATTT